MPFSLLSHETKTKHIVFESKWDEPVIQEKVLCELEIKYSTKSKWEKIEQWYYPLKSREWSELAEVGSSISTPTNKQDHAKEYIYPTDLHKYTGTKEEIQKDGFKASPSYLDFSNTITNE
jgi:hypothetical protein